MLTSYEIGDGYYYTRYTFNTHHKLKKIAEVYPPPATTTTSRDYIFILTPHVVGWYYFKLNYLGCLHSLFGDRTVCSAVWHPSSSDPNWCYICQIVGHGKR